MGAGSKVDDSTQLSPFQIPRFHILKNKPFHEIQSQDLSLRSLSFSTAGGHNLSGFHTQVRFNVYSCHGKRIHHKRSGNLQYQRCRLSVRVPTVTFPCLTTLLDGLKVIERFFNVPLDHAKPEGEKIRIFARHIIPKDKAKTPEEEAKLPYRESQLTEASSLIIHSDTGE